MHSCFPEQEEKRLLISALKEVDFPSVTQYSLEMLWQHLDLLIKFSLNARILCSNTHD